MEFQTTELTGAPIMAVFMIDGTPRSVNATVLTSEPFAIETPNEWAKTLEPGTKALFVYQFGDDISKASSRVAAVLQTGESWVVSTEPLLWESVDRRRHTRQPAQFQVVYRTVDDSNGEAKVHVGEAQATDLSLGGVCLTATHRPPIGALVDIGMSLGESSPARALGIVAWLRGGTDEFGVEFLDYMGGTKAAISGFLEQAA